ncbi:hypothetical protein [Ekhidna sp.]
MKTRSIYRILEGAFLFVIIIMIYILSIVSAKGQMAKEFPSIYELTQFHNMERIEVSESNSGETFEANSSTRNAFPVSPLEVFQIDESDQFRDTLIQEKTVQFPKNTLLKRRNKSEHQAPMIVIPL